MSAGDDDFDRLGAAVARVLRDAFQTAEDMRRDGIADAGDLAVRVGAEIERSLQEALALQSRVRREADDVLESVRSSTASAQLAVEDIIAAATREAEEIRAAAATEAKEIVELARSVIADANAAVEAQRVTFETDIGRIVGDLQRAVDTMQADNAARRRVALERASAEAAAILRQARMHHRATAAEVDRMIESAAAEAAALRKAARDDALRIAAEVSSVVDMTPRQTRPRKPAAPASAAAPGAREPGHRVG
jgi:hypothetical protein